MNPFPSHPLDNPVWNALAAAHGHLRQGDGLACRYLPDVAPFAALASDSAQAWQALAQLLRPGEQVAGLAWRGRGIAGRLIKRLQAGIQQRGGTPFLHVLASNHNAIALYERLGFTLRRTFFLTLVGQAERNV